MLYSTNIYNKNYNVITKREASAVTIKEKQKYFINFLYGNKFF